MRDGTPNAAQSTWLIAHSGMGHAFDLNLLLAFAPGANVKGVWFDPRKGETLALFSVDVSGKVRFTPPTSGSRQHDWVVIVKVQR